MKKLSPRAYFLKKVIDVFVIGLLLIMLLMMWTLYKGPISVPFLKPYIVQALNYDEEEYQVEIGDVRIEFVRSIQPLRVTADKILLKKNDETLSLSAPKLYLSFSLRALMKGLIAPSVISLDNPTVYVFASYGIADEQKNEINKKKLEYYIIRLKEILEHYNSEDKIYPESYVNNITVKNGEIEFHEVELGRKWMLSDVNFEFNRHLINMNIDANALVNINDKIASIGLESKYHGTDDTLDVELYFSDLILSDIFSTMNETTQDNLFSVMSIEVPVNGKINTSLNLAQVLEHPDEAENYVDTMVENVSFELDSGQGLITFEDEDKYNYKIDEMQLKGQLIGGIDELRIENAQFSLSGQKAFLDLHISGLESYYLEQSLQDVVMRLSVQIDEFNLAELTEFWPRYAAEAGWLWCKDGLVGGTAKDGKFVFDFGYDKVNETFGLVNLSGTAYLADGVIKYLSSMPPVEKVYGTAHFGEQNILIDLDKGVNNGVMITGGKVDIYDLNKENNYILIDLAGNCAIKDALQLIDYEPLKITSAMGIDPNNISGDATIKLKLNFELKEDLNSKDIKVDVDADLHNVKINELLAHHEIAADKAKLIVNSSGWSLNANGSFDDIPLTLSIKDNFAEKDYKSKCNIAFKLDQQTRKALGIDWTVFDEPNIKGYALVNADIKVKQNNVIDIQLKTDLEHAQMDYAYLGFVKQSGVPAMLTAHIVLQDDKIAIIDNILLHKADFDISGRVDMYASGRVKQVDIKNINGPKTSARAKVSFTDAEQANIKIDISGDSYNLYELFNDKDNEKSVQTPLKPLKQNEDDGLEKVNNTDVFVSVSSLWTNKTTPIKNFAGTAKLRRGIGIDEVHLVGNYGIDKSIKLKLDYVPRGQKEHYLSIDSNNAGSSLKVLRLYDNMVGGNLKIEARRDRDKKFIGHAMIRDFSIHDAPVMAKLLSVASLTGILDLLRGDGLTFTHFDAPFEYQYKTLQLKQAKAEGNVIGITADGSYNRAADIINIKGVIAPAYSLNRFLGTIPVVGNLLASKDGTIFAADYKIEGSTQKPEVDINSLSILSPNSMKEWYNENFGNSNAN